MSAPADDTPEAQAQATEPHSISEPNKVSEPGGISAPPGHRGFCGLGLPLIFMIIGLYILDQVTKWLVVLNFDPPGHILVDGIVYKQTKIVPVIEGFFNIVRVHNTGVAFGIGNGTAWSTYVFLAVPVIALTVILILFRKGLFRTPLFRFCGALILAGILGNLTDRLVQGFFLPGAETLGFLENLARGYVVDFIDVTIPLIDYRWPSFNVADSCVTVAATLLFIATLLSKDKSREREWENAFSA